jgi:hypothetical protein
MKLLHPVRGLLIRQANSDTVSHPFPQKAREWMGHPDSIPKEKCSAPVQPRRKKRFFSRSAEIFSSIHTVPDWPENPCIERLSSAPLPRQKI